MKTRTLDFLVPATGHVLGRPGLGHCLRLSWPSEPGYLTAIELKDPRPAPPDNGAPGERLRRHGHTISGRGKKLWHPL